MHARPAVSVIVPVLHDPAGIRTCVGALRRQTYPYELLELIVVDNGSTDDTPDVAAELGARVIRETEKRGSYAARNTGLRAATGEVIAFTDADCTPSERWVEQGVRPIADGAADLVGGRVRFVLSRPPRGAEIWDSVTNMQIEDNIRERGVAKTANLFVRREAFEAIGGFPDHMVSGGDVAWTGTATDHGFRLVYAPDAEVAHPARRLVPLAAKQYRVGKGQAALMAGQSGVPTRLRRVLSRLRPPSTRAISVPLTRTDMSPTGLLWVRLWAAVWITNAATGIGTLAGMIAGPSGREAIGR